jgi:2-polyprenyl-6-methoxyphenol hydroxylase-like FAD-dependent oxidoreductase
MAMADVIVGADGVHSRVRELLFGAEGPVFTGRVASHRVPHRDYGDTTAFTLLCPSRDGPRIFNFGIGG